MRSTMRLVVIVLGLLVATAACGGDDESDNDEIAACQAKGGVWVATSGCNNGTCEQR